MRPRAKTKCPKFVRFDFANKSADDVQLKEWTNKLSVNESMIRYYGRNRLKQVIKNKTIRFGYKAWVYCCADGLGVNFDVYQGADQGHGNKRLPLGIPVIDGKMKNAGVYDNEDVELYFGNFYS